MRGAYGHYYYGHILGYVMYYTSPRYMQRDEETNEPIYNFPRSDMVKLLQLSSTPEDVNLKCPKFGRTSLHYLSKVENGHSKYISNVL